MFLSHFTLVMIVIGSLRVARRERHSGQDADVRVERSRDDEALGRGHGRDRNLGHVCGGHVQRLRFTCGPYPPHLLHHKHKPLLEHLLWTQIVGLVANVTDLAK